MNYSTSFEFYVKSDDCPLMPKHVACSFYI